MMAGIGPKDTRPEMQIRRGLHALGYRYRLHVARLPGRPDLVFPRHRAVILVHGCFWHGHACHLFRWPGTRPEFWKAKITGNIIRDRKTRGALRVSGWRVLEIWECALRGTHRERPEAVLEACARFLDSDEAHAFIGVDQTVTTDVSA